MATLPATRSRSFRLLASSLRQRQWHWLFWVTSAGYLIAVFAIVLLFALLDRRGDPRGLFPALQFFHLFLALGLPAVLAARLVDDRISETLQFMQLAGFSADAWIRFRLLLIATEYFSVWALRVPFYAFLLHGGGVTWPDLIWAELIHTVLALTVAQTGLLTAARAELSPQTLFGTAAVSFLNFILMTPAGVMMFITRVWSLRMPPFFNWAAETLRSLSMFSYSFSPPVTAEGRIAAACGLLLHLVAGLIATLLLRRILYTEAEPGLAAAKGSGELQPGADHQRRPSRRVWSDPFFWHAAEYYFEQSPERRSTVAFFSLSLPIALAVAIRFDAAAFAAGIWAMAACVTTGMAPAWCAGRELKEKTLSSLAVLPCGGGAIYLGWKRAGDRYRLAAWLATCACLAVLAWRHPLLAVGWGAVVMASAWSFPPLAFIEALRSQERTIRRMISRIAIGAIAGPVASLLMLWSHHVIVVLAGIAALAACLYRPRAIRQMDEIFVRVSSQ